MIDSTTKTTIENGAPSDAAALMVLGSPHWATLTPRRSLRARLGNLFRRAVSRSSIDCRLRRGQLFIERLQPNEADRIIDVGGGKGGHIASLVPFRNSVTIADIDPVLLETAVDTYGFRTVRLAGSATLPISDKEYDIAFCSSVIEHITGPRDKIFQMLNSGEFAASAKAAQANFAAELRRISKRYFVQTPYKYFPLESHSVLPFFVILLPRRWQIPLLEFCCRHWIKAVQADFRLLTIKEMRTLFPDAEIVFERYYGFIKSIIAIRA